MLKRIWHDPVWSKVIAGLILLASAAVIPYFLHWWPSISNFVCGAIVAVMSQTSIPTWLFGILSFLSLLVIVVSIMLSYGSATLRFTLSRQRLPPLTTSAGHFMPINLPDTSGSYYDLPASPYGVILASPSSVPFRILPYVQGNCVKGHTTVSAGPRPDGLPNRNRIECDVQNVTRVYVLWTASNGWKSYKNVQFENRRIGSLELIFADGPLMRLPAILGQNIREWIYHNASLQGQDVVSVLSDASVSQFWHSLEDLHTLDMLKIDIQDPPRHLRAIELVGEFEFLTNLPGEHLPHFRVSALTCELV